MANTERLAALEAVREAKSTAQKIRFDTSLPEEDRKKAEEAFIELDELEDDLELEAIEEKVSALEKAGGRLEKVADQLKKQDEKLKDFADKLETAAKALSILVAVASKAATIV
jgi:archaellum component FlaC